DGQSLARLAEREIERVSLSCDRWKGSLAGLESMESHPSGRARHSDRAARVEDKRRMADGFCNRREFPVAREISQVNAALLVVVPRKGPAVGAKLEVPGAKVIVIRGEIRLETYIELGQASNGLGTKIGAIELAAAEADESADSLQCRPSPSRLVSQPNR